MSARVVDADRATDGGGADVGDERAQGSPDDLRLRLDSPLFAREPGLAAAAAVPGLRELTWEHVINPTTSQPVVPAGPAVGDDGTPRPTPIRIEDLLARPEPALAPLPERADAPATQVVVPPLPTTSHVVEPAAAPGPTTGASALPSFAAMLSGEVASVSSMSSTVDRALPNTDWTSEHLADEGLVKPIEEPPPVARDTDPAVNGLAELIVKSTPGGGMPRVDVFADPMRPMTGQVPVVPREELDPPVLDAAVEFAIPQAHSQAPVPVAPSSVSPPLYRDTGVHPIMGGSAVQAELNRLAYVPDLQEDPDGPVEIPEIAYSDVRSAEPAMNSPQMTGPVLSQHEMFTPRQATTVHRHSYIDLVGAPAVPAATRRRNRHVVRKIMTTVVLLGMVAGGLFAVKYLVLDRVKWAGDIAPMATAVENQRGLHFDHDVPIVSLSATEYATKIVGSLGGVTSDAMPMMQGRGRALGVVTGSLDTTAVGLAALVDSPAFYDPATPTIYVVAGTDPVVKKFAMHRALTMALLDQQYKWGKDLIAAAPAVVIGTRAVFDADALAVAHALLTPADAAAMPSSMATLRAPDPTNAAAFVTPSAAPTDPSPFLSSTIGRIGVPLWPYLASLTNSQRDALERNSNAVMTDDHALDLRRLVGGARDTVGSNTQGMLFWYHALASRLDDSLSWIVALGWRGDDVVTDTATGTICVSATVSIDGPLAETALAVFTAWAAAAPPASTTSVTLAPVNKDGIGVLTIHACDPGPDVPTNDGTVQLSAGAAPLRTQQFVDLLKSTPRPTATLAACVVYTLDPVSIADERGVVDPANGWDAPTKHPAPDLTTPGCVAASPSGGSASSSSTKP